jgi:hypothetical protein
LPTENGVEGMAKRAVTGEGAGYEYRDHGGRQFGAVGRDTSAIDKQYRLCILNNEINSPKLSCQTI